MKIKRIRLANIGPYINDNDFEFDLSDNTRRIVLIGGKNGAGKTTLFTAIKTCLYGCIAYGFATPNSKYFAEIESIINANEKLKKVGEARIIVDLVLDDGKYDSIYTFSRKWKIAGKKIAETFDVLKDDKILNSAERDDFTNYILNLLPPNLFRFFFFNGEQLSNFVLSGNKDSDFKEAFLKLCNLDTMEIIRSNFRRIARNSNQDSTTSAKEYDDCLKDDQVAQGRIDAAQEEYDDHIDKLIEIDENLASLEKSYSKDGGISKQEWKNMQEQLAKEEVRREEKRKWLKDIANNTLPFIIVRDQLIALQGQINLEQNNQMAMNVKNAINTPVIYSIISNVLREVHIELSDDIAQKIIAEICDYTKNPEDFTPILNISNTDSYELISKINSLLAFDIDRIKKATSDIEASLQHSKRIRKKMERSSIDRYDEYLQKKSELNEKKAHHSAALLDIEKEIQQLKSDKAVTSSRLAKAKSSYEAILKKRSINDISARSLLAFDELQEVLYEKSIKDVELQFQIHFNSLINKSDLIDGIHIDNNLNVIPYKNRLFDATSIKSMLDKNGDEAIIAQIGFHAYEIMKEKIQNHEPQFELPIEVKQQFSAGEKQIFVMALYQALANLSKISVPYIIDTPFARIDKEHRNNILEHFFRDLKGQIIVLSTDEEIVESNMSLISDIISNTFTLNHTASGNTEIIPNAYFGEKNDK